MKHDTRILGPSHEFQETSWTLVGSLENMEAMDALVRLYWKPLYFFVRQHGYPNEEAKDIVQGFLTSMMERRALSKADPSRGRFRTFLLASMMNYLKDRIRSAGREKRGGGSSLFSLDFIRGEEEFSSQVASGETPEEVLNRAWAKELWTHSLAALEGDPTHLEAFRRYLWGEPYAMISEATGLSNEAAKMAVHRLKAQLRETVTGTLRESVADPEELEGELAHFLALLAKDGVVTGMPEF